MAQDITVTWKLPILRGNNAPLPITDIRHTILGYSSDGGETFTDTDIIAPDSEQKVVFQQQPPGTHHFRAKVIPLVGDPGMEAFTSYTVPPDVETGAPHAVTDFVATGG